MRNRLSLLLVVACLFVGVALNRAGAAFTPLFQVVEVKGLVTAQVPDSGESKQLHGGEGLAYGSILRTGADGSVVIILGGENQFTLGPDAAIVLGTDPDKETDKILELHRGIADISLIRDFEQANGFEIVTRCVRIRQTQGGGASIETTTEADLRVVVITCKGGQLESSGPDFLIPVMKENDSVTIACSQDGGFLRIRSITGKFALQIKDSSGNPRTLEMVEDSVVKILRKVSDADPNIMIVTILEVGADGNVIQADTYEEPASTKYKRLLNSDEPALGGTKPPAPGSTQPLTTATFPTTTSSTSTSTTTTTSKPGDLIPTTTRPTTTTRPEPPPATTRPPITPSGRT